jgi:hypothetical protein
MDCTPQTNIWLVRIGEGDLEDVEPSFIFERINFCESIVDAHSHFVASVILENIQKGVEFLQTGQHCVFDRDNFGFSQKAALDHNR